MSIDHVGVNASGKTVSDELRALAHPEATMR